MSQERKLSTRELLAKRVRQYRKLRDLSCEELSLSIGCDNSYISKLENCNMNPTLDVLDLIAQRLSVEVKDLFQ